jgi:hypothetical protein
LVSSNKVILIAGLAKIRITLWIAHIGNSVNIKDKVNERWVFIVPGPEPGAAEYRGAAHGLWR